jgi:ketosteroid isomerase-like protein
MYARPLLQLSLSLAAVTVLLACARESDADRTTTATGSVSSDAEARDAIRRQAAQMVAIWPSENLDSIMPRFSDDAVLQFPDMPDARGRDAVREALKQGFDAVEIQSLDTEIDTIEVFDDVAYEWGRYTERMAETGKPPVTAQGRYLMRWQRGDDGSWKVTRFTGNSIKEEPSPRAAQ